MTAANPTCPDCKGTGIDPDSRPTYHDGAPGIADPAGYEPCECVLAQGEIDAAIEQVVKASSDRQTLVPAVHALAGLPGYQLNPVIHGAHGGRHEQRDGIDVYVAPCGATDAPYLTETWADNTCERCLHTLSDDGIEPDPQQVATEFLDRLHATTAVEYEDDPEPQPRHGDHGTCAVCGGEIRYHESTDHFGYVFSALWLHDEQAADGHDAELGGPA